MLTISIFLLWSLCVVIEIYRFRIHWFPNYKMRWIANDHIGWYCLSWHWMWWWQWISSFLYQNTIHIHSHFEYLHLVQSDISNRFWISPLSFSFCFSSIPFATTLHAVSHFVGLCFNDTQFRWLYIFSAWMKHWCIRLLHLQHKALYA